MKPGENDLPGISSLLSVLQIVKFKGQRILNFFYKNIMSTKPSIADKAWCYV